MKRVQVLSKHEMACALCERHAKMLAAALKAAGLDAFESKSIEEANARATAAHEAGEPSRASFDPCLVANRYIIQAAINAGGPALIVGLLTNGAPADHVCPVCVLNSAHDATCNRCGPDACDDVIEWATAEALDDAKRLGLVGTA
jgi:hypothetical protein